MTATTTEARQRSLAGPPLGVGFRGDEVERAALILRGWVRGCLTQAFSPELGASAEPSGLLGLTSFLGTAQDPPRAASSDPAGDTFDRWLPRADAERMRDLGIRFSSRRPYGFSQRLWSLVGQLAWRQPALQSSVAADVQAYLRRRVIFVDGELPVVTLRPQVCWLLVALFGAPRLLPARPGWWPRVERYLGRDKSDQLWRGWQNGDSVEIAARLSLAAQAQVREPAWAGFWEQWVLCEMLLRQGPNAAPWLPVLAALPLLSQGGCQQVTGAVRDRRSEDLEALWPAQLERIQIGDEEAAKIVDPRWQEQMPRWFDRQWLAHGRLLSPVHRA